MRHSPSPWQSYLFAAGATGAAWLIRFILSEWLGSHAPFLPFVAAVVLAAWLGGLGPGLFAAAIGTVVGTLLLLHEQGWRIGTGDLLHLALFIGTASLISLLSEHLHTSRRRLAVKEQELSGRLEELQAILAERQHAEQEKEQALAMLRSLVSSAPVGIALLGEDLRFDLVNEPLAEINGIPVEAHLGKSVRDIVPGILETVEPVYREVLETGQAFKDLLIEGETPKAPGVRRAWIESWFPVSRTEGGKPSGVGVVVQEVTDRVRAERQLRESQEALQETDRKKDEFLATLAHELRNPLAPLRNSLELVRLSGGRAGEQTLTIMDRQLNQLVRLIDDLLDVSRITSGKLELRKERVQLSDVAEAAIETSRPVIEASRHTLAVDLPPGILVDADRIRLAQVFSNLLSNAAKYTEPGGEIRLTAGQRDGEVVVTVEDNGVGIPADMLTGVFDLFTQVDRSLERSQGGLGIGLTLAKRLSEMHGGSIEAESRGEGRGSTFTVRLPAAAALPADDARETAGRVEAAQKRRVLVVDDNEDSAVSLAEILELRGNDVRTASNGLEAIEKAEAFRPDVILLDIGMPKLNGYDAARKIRELPWGGNVRLIALTGWGQEEDKRRARESGFDHHLVKPVDVGTLETLLIQT